MTTRIVGVFADPDQARQALDALHGQNVPEQAISAIIHAPDQANEANSDAAQVSGAAVGSGALALAGLTALLVPYIGPLLTAGAFAGSLGVAASANAKHAGTLQEFEQALVQGGLTESQAEAYAQRVSEGNSLIAVDIPDDHVNAIADILHANGGMGLDYRPVSG